VYNINSVVAFVYNIVSAVVFYIILRVGFLCIILTVRLLFMCY